MGIVNRDGSLYMATGIDNSGLYSGLNKAEGRIDQFGNHISSVGDKIAKLTGIGFGVAGLKAFGSEIINVRGEMQMLESSFEVLLGGKGVSGFMAEMKQFAVDSPLSLTHVGDAAQMLLAFGVEAGSVMSTVKQLGDVSMGNSSKFQSLALAFSQMTSAGKVLSQDLRQMATAGFNPLGEIARTTGKTIQEVTALMDNGQITVKQVAGAFASATAEGGKFYGMTQKQAEGIKGLQAQLEGGLQDAFNEIGESQEGLIAGGYKASISLVANYKAVGEALTALIATYGVYKASMVMTAAIDKTANTLKYTEEAKALEEVISKQKHLISEEQKIALSKNGLVKGSKEYADALRKEIELAMTRSSQSQLSLQSELTSARGAIKARELSILGLREEIIQRETSLQGLKHMTAAESASMTVKQKKSAQRRIENAEKKINTEYTKLNTLELERNSLKRTESAAAAKLNSEGMRANSLQTQYNTASQNANAASTNFLSVAKSRLTKVARGLWAALAPNPYVLAAVAVVALGYGIYKLATYQTEAEKAQNRLNDALKDVSKELVSEERALDSYNRKLGETKKGTDDYKKLKDEIVKKYGAYFSGLSEEIDRVGNLSTAYETLTESIKRSIAQRQLEVFENSENDSLNKEISEKSNKAYKSLIDKYGKDQGADLYKSFHDYAINGIEQDTDVWNSWTQASDGWLSNVTNLAIEVKNLKQSSSQAVADFKEINQVGSAIDIYTPTDKSKIENFAEQIDNARTKVSSLEAEFKSLQAGTRPHDISDSEQFDFSKGIEDKAKALKEAKDKLSFLLTGKSSSEAGKKDDSAEKRLEAQRKLDEAYKQRQIDQLAFDFEMRQKEIDLMDDSFEKRIAQLKLNQEKEQQVIDGFRKKIAKDQYEESKNQYVKKHGNDNKFEAYYSKLTPADLAQSMPIGLTPADIEVRVKAMTDAAKKAQESGLKEINRDLSLLLKEQELMFASDKDKKLSDLDAYYNNEKNKLGERTLDNADYYDKLTKQIEANRKREKTNVTTDDNLQRLDFEEQLKLERVAGMESIGMTELVEEKKLEITKQYLQQRIDALKVLADAGDEDAKRQMQINEASLKKLDTRKPAKSLKSLADKAIFDTIKKGFEEAGDSAEEAEGKTTKLLGSISAKAGMVANITSELQSMFGGMDEGLDMALETVGNIAQGFATGGIVGGAMAVISEGMKLFSKASEAAARHQQALKEIADARLASQRAYNLLLMEQNLLLEEAVSIFGEKQITRAANAIANYKKALKDVRKEMQGDFVPDASHEQYLEKRASSGDITGAYFGKQLQDYQKQVEDYNKGVAKLADQKIVTGHKKSGLFGLGKGKDTYSSILDEYDDVIDKEGKLNIERIENILATRKMSDETKNYLQNLVDLENQAEAALAALRDYLQNTFGALGAGAIDSIVDSIRNGTDAWVEFGKVGANVLEKLGEQIAYELFFADKFKKLQDDLEKVYGSGKSSEQITKESMDLIGKYYENIGSDMELAQNWMDKWKVEAEKQGFDLWNNESSSQQASKGYSVSMDQPTGDKLVGIGTSNQMTFISMDSKLGIIQANSTESLLAIKNYGATFIEMRNIALQSMSYLEDISTYTKKYLPAIANDVSEVKRNTSDL